MRVICFYCMHFFVTFSSWDLWIKKYLNSGNWFRQQQRHTAATQTSILLSIYLDLLLLSCISNENICFLYYISSNTNAVLPLSVTKSEYYILTCNNFFYNAEVPHIPGNDRRWNYIQNVRNNWECWASSISTRLQVRLLLINHDKLYKKKSDNSSLAKLFIVFVAYCQKHTRPERSYLIKNTFILSVVQRIMEQIVQLCYV